MSEDNDTERAARRLVHDLTQLSEGQFVRDTRASDHPATMALWNRFRETAEGRRQCSHLAVNFDQVRFWYEPVPELLACNQCEPLLEDEEEERDATRCLLCGSRGSLRGITFTYDGYVLHGGMCQDCQSEHGLPGA